MTERRAGEDSGLGAGPLREKINYLFETVHPRGRGPWSHPEVHRATGISTATLSALRSGKNTNPTMETLQKLADFFHVDPAFFFDTAASAEIRRQLDQLRALQSVVDAIDHSTAETIVARMADLSPRSLHALAELAETLRALEEDGT